MRHYLYLLFFCLPISYLSQEIRFTDKEIEWIKNHPVIEFGYEPRWEPYEIYSNGDYGGIVGDYIKIIEEKTGIDMRPIPNLTWEQSMNGFSEGSIKVVPCLVSTPSRRSKFELTKPYIIDPIVIAAKNGASYFSTLEDLSNKTIALSKNYYTHELIQEQYPDIVIRQFNTIQECLEDVTMGKSDAFVGNLNVISYYRNHYGFEDLKIVGVTPFKVNGISLAVNSEWKVFKEIVDKVFSNVSPFEQHQIRKKWIGINQANYFSSPLFLWTVVISLSILIGFIIVYYWNRVLKKIIKRKKETEQQLKRLLIEVKKSDEDKKVLLQEIHHRVKNNLQIVSSMLKMQANTTKNKKISLALEDATERIQTIALVHNKLYKTPTIDQVNVTDYTQSLFQDIQSQYPEEKYVELIINSSDINVSMDFIVPMALILNELITNSFKHAFQKLDTPEITININWDDAEEKLRMIYKDNGAWKENDESDRFGTSLIDIFTEQIDGNYSIKMNDEGTSYVFEFKILDTNTIQ